MFFSYSYFEKWIFHGFIQDPHKELFVDFNDHYRSKTKCFWDKAYLIKRQSVPGFLVGYEDITLLCGKYTMLLKSYKRNHPLFSIVPPKIKVCLSFSKIKQTEIECDEYRKRAQSVCGDPISVADVFKQKSTKKDEFLKMVAEKFRQNMIKWQADKETKAIEIREGKEKDRAILVQQMAEVREKKIQTRRENLALEREYLRLEQVAEDKRLFVENMQRQKTIDYYTELGELVDAQRERADELVKKLRKQLSGTETVNIINDDRSTATVSSCNETQCPVPLDNAELENIELESIDDKLDIQICVDKNTDDINIQNANYNTVILKKSASDFFNSNEPEINTAIQNKTKMLGSTLDLRYSDKKNQLKTATFTTNALTTSTLDNIVNEISSCDTNCNVVNSEMLDREKNKLKILGQEYDIISQPSYLIKPIIQLTVEDTSHNQNSSNEQFHLNQQNATQHHHTFDYKPADCVLQVGPMTDLQRNRNKMLNEEFGFGESTTADTIAKPSVNTTEFSKNQLVAGQHKHTFDSQEIVKETSTEPMTDAEINRQKLMFDEFGGAYDTKEMKQSLSLDFAPKTLQTIDLATPMSTSSDTPLLSEHIEEDITNANIESLPDAKQTQSRKRGTLKLKTKSIAPDLPDYCGIPNTANLANPTPESALNTSGLLANNNGFVFTVNNSTSNSLPFRTTYEESSDLLKSNFSSSSKTEQFFGINLEEYGRTANEPPFAELLQLDDLQIFDCTTIAKCLQMSFVIPMQAQLAVLNNEILKIYLLDFDILSHFKSLRNYFFMMDGEFASHICDSLINKLENHVKPEQFLNFYVLHSLLENALGSSIIGDDHNADKLSFIVDEIPEQFDLTSPNALNMLSLTYAVEWPLNLLLNPETIIHYAKIFQHLLKLRRIRWVLDKTYQVITNLFNF